MTITGKNEKLKRVTVVTEQGGIGMADIDADGKMVWRAGHYVSHISREQVDLELRADIAQVINDNGAIYKLSVSGLDLPPMYLIGDEKDLSMADLEELAERGDRFCQYAMERLKAGGGK